MVKKNLAILIIIFLMGLSTPGLATDWPGIGAMCAGDLWESFVPSGITKYYSESETDVTKNALLLRLGNLDRQWTCPTFHYPDGDIFTLTWTSNIWMTEYHPTEPIGAYREAIAGDKENYMNYCDAFWMASMGNTSKTPTTNSNTHGGPPWLDDTRTQMVYEFSMPTNIGVDVTGRVRQYSFNEANMNDFIAMELELTNTGVQDNNCDGTVDRSNHKIEALSLLIHDETFGSMALRTRGTRWTGWWPPSRLSGYDGSPDPEGNPWDVTFCWRTGVSQSDVGVDGWAADEKRKVSYHTSRGIFADIWNGQQWIAVRQGGLGAGSAAPDKMTIYGSHPIGEGAERGWYVTRNRTKIGEPYGHFIMATGVFYEEGGKTEDPALFTGKSIKPDPNYFDTSQAYTVGDPVSFASLPILGGQPMGDMKYTNYWIQNWEKNYPNTPSPQIPDADQWTAGGTPKTAYNFGSGASSGIGPFSLEVGETITAVMIEHGGYRLKGVRNAMAAARFAYENDWNVPVPPPMPEMNVMAVPFGTTVKPRIVWDDRAEAAADFAGYKIYRVTAYPEYETDQLGYRFMDRYHHQTAADIGATDAELVDRYCEPINPNNSVPADYNITWGAGTHGPWKIVAHITSGELASVANTGDDAGTYAYEWIDESDDVQFGYTMWYYVAAYDDESGTIAWTDFSSLESGKSNFNGRWGEWLGTYPWATAAIGYPTTSASKKEMGAPFVLIPPRADAEDLVSGELEILVKPNPYVIQAPHDNPATLEHKIMFYNLTANTKITIFDLSGQIMDVIEYFGQNPQDGKVFWDMFTKDGPEVQSGLYIWVAEYPGGQQMGHLAIMR